MARLSAEYVGRARDLMALYPEPRSALLPLLHLAQEQDGWVSPEAMDHIADLLGIGAAEVLGTCSFYSMFKMEPVGKYLISVCTNIACLLNGGYELLQRAESTLGINAGATTPDGEFTLEEVECIAACGSAPCLQVNYRYVENVDSTRFDGLIEQLRSGKLAGDIPKHGVLCRVRRTTKVASGPRTSSPTLDEGAAGTGGPANSVDGDNGENQPADADAVATATKDAQVIDIDTEKRRRQGKEG